MPKSIDAQARLGCARTAVGVLRTLQITNSKLSYRDFARAIGLMSDEEAWRPWHQQQVKDILILVAATERKAGGKVEIKPLQFDRIINAREGRSGIGVHNVSKIVTERRRTAT